MGLRDDLANNASSARIVLAALIAACFLAIFLEVRGPRRLKPAPLGKAFYSDDDGKTWFQDDWIRGSPFEHDGKKAYRALVYKCGSGGKPFVAYLAKFSNQQVADMQADLANTPPGTQPRELRTPQDLKKPGETNWIVNKIRSTTGYPDVPCPDGSGKAFLLRPGDANSGAIR